MDKSTVNGFKKKKKMKIKKKNERLKSLEKKYFKAQKRLFTVALHVISSEIPENSKNKKNKKNKKFSALETCGVTKYRSITLFVYCNFLKILKNLLLKSIKKP